MDVLDRADLPFPHSLPEFQRLFPDDAACAAYLEKARWGDGFACPHCGTAGEPCHFENRPGVLRCRKCRQNTGLTVGTVMERSHTPLNVWFWAAYLVASQTPGMSAVQFQRQLGLSRYETAFQILHKLRSGISGSILEGLDEILTVIRLGLPHELRRSLACTNIVENALGTVRQVTRNVKRWRHAEMALRWTAAGLLEAQKTLPSPQGLSPAAHPPKCSPGTLEKGSGRQCH